MTLWQQEGLAISIAADCSAEMKQAIRHREDNLDFQDPYPNASWSSFMGSSQKTFSSWTLVVSGKHVKMCQSPSPLCQSCISTHENSTLADWFWTRCHLSKWSTFCSGHVMRKTMALSSSAVESLARAVCFSSKAYHSALFETRSHAKEHFFDFYFYHLSRKALQL